MLASAAALCEKGRRKEKKRSAKQRKREINAALLHVSRSIVHVCTYALLLLLVQFHSRVLLSLLSVLCDCLAYFIDYIMHVVVSCYAVLLI